jgi:branched-chain amino acid transport system substrate-binding protein
MQSPLIKKILLTLVGLSIGALPAFAAETMGPVTDDIGVVKIRKGAPMFIGGYWTLSGPDVGLGLDQKRGVELAFDDWDNMVAGHKIRLLAEDSQCNAEGGQTATTKLASNRNIVAVLGPDCSSSATPGAPILWKAGMVNIGTSTTAPALTAPDRKPGYHGYLRTIYNDLAQGAADATYFREQLKCDTLVTIHDGSPYAEQLVRVAEKEFAAMGGEVVATEAVTPTDVDMRPMLTSIATYKPCVVYFPIFVAATAQIVRQAPEIDGLENTNLMAGPGAMTGGFLEAAGESANGLRLTAADVGESAMAGGYGEVLARYKEKYGENPPQAYHAHAYDAGQILLKAIQEVAVKDDKGDTYIGRMALRDALFATKGHAGISGPIECDENGDCGGFAFAVFQFSNADPDSFEIGVNPAKIYP